jgi:hypothetical protein
MLHCAETSWKLYPNGILPWADRGSDNVTLDVSGNEKDCFTVMATISLSRTKLPLYILGKGLTERCERSQFGEVQLHQTDHSRTDWTTEDTMLRYITWLHEQLDSMYGPGHFYHLIMDIYRVHVMPAVKRRAHLLGFKVHFIPAGRTDQLQPLDRTVFGCLKATARSLYCRFVHDAPGAKVTPEDAVEIFQRSWETLSGGALEAAWAIYEEQEPPKVPLQRRRRLGGVHNDVRRSLSLYEAIAIEGILCHMTETKPYVGMQ